MSKESSTHLFSTVKTALQFARNTLLASENMVIRASGNIKTTADLIAQNAIVETLKKENISCIIYSEESAEPIILGDGEYEISMDPVDNSYLFVKGITAFSSIALTVVKNGKVLYAFVQSLGPDEMYYCTEAKAFLGDDELKVHEKEPPLIAAYAARSDRFDLSLKLQQLSGPFHYLNTGGPLLSAMVASNNFSATVELLPASFYESAGWFIAQKAGAFVETIDGSPLTVDPHARHAVIVANSEHLLRELQRVLRS